MKRKIATAAAVLLLAGCGNGDGEPSVPDEPSAEAAPEETAAEVTPEPAPTATLEEPDTEEPAEPARSDRDNLVKALGELGGITDSNGEMLISFWVDEIQVDFECTRDFVEEPQNGHYVGVHFRVE